MKITSAEFRERLKRLRLSAERLRARRAQGNRDVARVGSGLEFAGHRAYVPGDDVRYLDWNALGRLEQLVLKTFDAPNELSVMIAIEPSATMAFGEPDKFEHAKELAAAVGYVAIYAGDRVILQEASNQPREYRSSTQELDFLRAIEALTADSKRHETFQKDLLTRLAGLRGDVLLVLISDFQDADRCQTLLKEAVHRKVKALVLHPFAPEELWPDLAGNLKFSILAPDGSESLARATVTPSLLADYQEELVNFRIAVSHFCRRMGVPRLEMATTQSMEDVVLELVAAGLLRVASS